MMVDKKQRIDVGALRKAAPVLTAEPANFRDREVDYPLERIVVGKRHRPLGDVSALAESMASPMGQLQPIVLLPDGTLVVGNHRVAAARMLGWTTIRATIKELDALDAELAEIDENLRRTELTVLEQADHLLRREQILEAKGLRAQRGDNQHSGGGETVSPPPTATTASVEEGEMGFVERIAPRGGETVSPPPFTTTAGVEEGEMGLSEHSNRGGETVSPPPNIATAGVTGEMDLSERSAQGGGKTVSPPRAAAGTGETDAPVPRTTAAIAGAMGLSERSAQQRLQIARNLDPDLKDRLAGSELANSTSQLLELARMDPGDQRMAADLVLRSEADNVRHAAVLLSLDPDVRRSLIGAPLHNNVAELAELARLDREQQRQVAALLITGKAYTVRQAAAINTAPAPRAKPYLSVDEIVAALTPVLADENPQIIYACANGHNVALFAACQRALHPDPARQADICNALHAIAAARGVTMIASITDEAAAPTEPAHDEATQAGDAWAAALAVQGNKQARMERLATAILPWIRTYEDHHGRSWQDLAQTGNPSHSSSIFWYDITREARRRELRIADDVLKGAIRQAFTWLEMEAQAAALASTATDPEADPANLELPVSQPSNLASADSQPPTATRSAWPYWEAQGWRLFCDEHARKGDPNLTAVHDGSQVATPWLTSEAGVIHWLSSGEPVTHNRYVEVTARMEKAQPDQRNARIAAMLETLRAAVDMIVDYEGITGIHSHSGALRRAVQPMIEMLERNRVEKEEA
jgi:hypothetical protein